MMFLLHVLHRLVAFLLLLQPIALYAFAPSAPLLKSLSSSSCRLYLSSTPLVTVVEPFVPVSSALEDTPIPFVDRDSMTFLECFADCTCTLTTSKATTAEYTIGIPCDTAVALCWERAEDGELVPIDQEDTQRLDDVYPMAEAIVAEEFGEELSLQRTPQTLTLMGELDDDFDDDEGYEGDEEDEMNQETDESVEVLLSFEHRDEKYHLVRLLDPVLIVGKTGTEEEDDEPGLQRRYLLTLEESKAVMPTLERLFLEYNEQQAQLEEGVDEFAGMDDFTVV